MSNTASARPRTTTDRIVRSRARICSQCSRQAAPFLLFTPHSRARFCKRLQAPALPASSSTALFDPNTRTHTHKGRTVGRASIPTSKTMAQIRGTAGYHLGNQSSFGGPSRSEATNDPSPLDAIRQQTSKIEDWLDTISDPIKPYLPYIGRFLIIVTFLEDALRIITQWPDQLTYLRDYRHSKLLPRLEQRMASALRPQKTQKAFS